MGLAEYLAVLRKRWLVVAAATLIGVLVGIAATVLATPTYQAASQVFVSVRGGDSVNEMVAGRAFTDNQVYSYAELVSSPRVLEPVIEELGLDTTPASLADRVTAERPKSTVLITITVSDESPDLAARIANSIATNLSAVVSDLERLEGVEVSPVEINTIRDATVPSSPSSPRPAINLFFGWAIGLICGFGIAVLREVLDTKIRSQNDLQELTDSSVIGAITFDPEAHDHPLIVQESPQAPRAEAFRRLRTNLQFLEIDGGARTFVVTSALPGEGKSTTSINLAITLADAGSRVLIVDADLRRPSVSKYLGVEGAVGLTTVLIGKVRVEDAVQPWGGTNLDILPSGQIPPNPSELLGSEHMARVLQELGEAYDVVIVDTAPLLPVTDGAILAQMTGGAVVVVGAGLTHRPQLAEALDALGKVRAKVLGVVLNRIAPSQRDGYGYGGYYQYGPGSPEDVGSHGYDGIPRHGRSKGLLEGLSGKFSWPTKGVLRQVPDTAESSEGAVGAASAAADRVGESPGIVPSRAGVRSRHPLEPVAIKTSITRARTRIGADWAENGSPKS